MKFNNFKYSEKSDSYKTLINVYKFKTENIDISLRSDYNIIITDHLNNQEIISIPERIKITKINCYYIDDNKTLLMIELKLKDLDIPVLWI